MQAKLQNPGLRQKIKNFARHIAYANPVYSASLNGEAPTHLQHLPRDPWAGDAAQGQAILRGVYLLAGREYKTGSKNIWQQDLPFEAYRELHGFRWLRHLHAVGGNEARQAGRQHIADWLALFHNWDEKSWRPGLIGERLSGWLSQYAFFGSSAGQDFREAFLSGLMRQLRHGLRVYDDEKFAREKMTALKGFLFTAAALPEGYLSQEEVIGEIEDAIHAQILADGCHYLRSPSLHMQMLRDLLEMRSLYNFAQQPVPRALQDAIEAMARALRYLRHGDGGLALFHGSFEEQADFLELMLVAANVKGKAGDVLEDGGWHRLNAGRTLIIMDAGASPIADDLYRHEGRLAFEMSAGRERMIVSCGSGLALGGEWGRAATQAAAHSTVDAAGLENASIETQRRIVDGNLWLEARGTSFSLSHCRRIYLSSAGDDARGEDILERAANHNDPALPFTVRFHLHPSVQVAEAQNSVLLRLPGGAGWRIRASGGKIGVADSIYLGHKGQIQKSKQVFIDAELIGASAQVKWAVQKEGKR